ncbi:helix-turn-helix transcriptional regulator [Piscinibacter aquaticus]|uniref:Helix-turn-helix transcriptional regulator n=1 Tax=Piscinibacter aquaticus TaxID=392597 RepID=A0A5C6U3Y6_9BURK|nr:helix-turn-helix transcriptional regulator [Piscinibacter aquaticus]
MAGPAVLAELAARAWRPALDGTAREALAGLANRAAAWRGGGVPAAAASTPLPPSATVAAAESASALSSREREVLERIAAGDSNKVIARVLDISPHTVKRHVANILDKLALQSRGQAAAAACQPLTTE